MHQIYHQSPAPLTRLRDGVSPTVDAVIQRALNKDPGQRYRGWDEFAQALSALIAQQHVPARPAAGRARLGALHAAALAGLLRQLRRRRAVEVVHRAGGSASTSATRSTGAAGGQRPSTSSPGRAGGVPRRRARRPARRRHQRGRDGHLAPSAELRRHSTDVIVTETATTISFSPETLAQLSPGCRHRFDEGFIRVLVRRLHAAHEALAHPRRIL